MAGLLNAIDVLSQGLSVQRKRMNVAAENIANAETTETRKGGPYQRKRVIVEGDSKEDGFKSHLQLASTRLMKTNKMHLPAQPLRYSTGEEEPSIEGSEQVDKNSKFRLVYDPTHPDADEDGYVKMPDVEIINEMVDMMAASRSYEANTVAIATAKRMANEALDIA